MLIQEEKQFQERLKKVFIEEAQNLISDFEELMVKFEKANDEVSRIKVIVEVFNIIHSLKASTGSVGYGGVSKYLHVFEFFFRRD